MRHEHHPHGPLEPQDVEELLPWYVTGRVSREEARGIEAALKTMPDLADKLTQVQREREAIARAAETVESAPPEALQSLLQQVETTRQWRISRVESSGEAGGWLQGALGRNMVWQGAFAAACIAIVALGVRLYNPPTSQGEFGTATGISEIAAGTSLLVTFQPSATAAEVAALLTESEATIVDGPKPGGTYVVRVPAQQADDVTAAMAALASHKDLVLAVLRGS
ncbi:MAG: anti-sigma factor family protein [Dongiaceae bacterium]